MMIAGIAVTAATVGALLDPYTPGAPAPHRRLRLRRRRGDDLARHAGHRDAAHHLAAAGETRHPVREGIAEVWSEPRARDFTVFVFLSMTAYFMQELILEPYRRPRLRLHAGPVHRACGRAERRRASSAC